MGRELVSVQPPASDQLHPSIYAIIVGLVLLFVVSALAFADSGYVDYLIAVVAGFFIIAMSIPYFIWLSWRRHSGVRRGQETLRDWSAGECDTWQCRLSGREAAIQTLLPIAAVAFGMAAIGIVLLLVSHNAV